MRLATIRLGETTRATVLDAGGGHHVLPAPSVDALLAIQDRTEMVRRALDDAPVGGQVELAPVVTTFTTLRAGDLVLTGAPSGVGSTTEPPSYLRDDSRVVTEIEGIGQLDNTVRFPPEQTAGPTGRPSRP